MALIFAWSSFKNVVDSDGVYPTSSGVKVAVKDIKHAQYLAAERAQGSRGCILFLVHCYAAAPTYLVSGTFRDIHAQ